MESSRRPWYQSDDGGPRYHPYDVGFSFREWKVYRKKYKNVSDQELILVRRGTTDKKNFECVANILNRRPPTKKRDNRDTDDLERFQLPIHRGDGSIIAGLTPSIWLSYLREYKNVSQEQLIALRDSTSDNRSFECLATILNHRPPENRDFMDTDDDGDDGLLSSRLPLPHGSKVVGLTPSKWRAYLKRYKNIPKQDLIAIRDTCFHFHKGLFEFKAGKLDCEKATTNSSSSGDETIYPFGRLDGCFLTSSEWQTYLKTYPHLSELELAEIRDSIDDPVHYKMFFELGAEGLDLNKKIVKSDGLRSTLAIPLFMLLSVLVKPRAKNKPFSVYGEITHHRPPILDRGYLYKRNFDEVEKFGSDGGNLTLSGPSPLCRSEVVSYTLESRKLSIKLYDENQRTLADGCVDLAYSQDEFEEVKETVVDIGELSLTVKYVSIPMAIFGCVEFGIFKKRFSKHVNLLESVNVCGKVVATYKNTFGNYNSEEIVLFDKNADKNEYEKVDIGLSMNLLSPTRCWAVVPLCSLLHLHIDLFEFQTNKTILKEDVDLETHRAYGYSKEILATEFYIEVSASWFDPFPLGQSQDADATSVQGESKDADATSGQGESKDADDSAQGEPKDADATSGPGESKDADDSAQGESKDAHDSAQGESKDADDSAQGEFKDADGSAQVESRDADDSAQGESKDGGGDGVRISGILESCATLQKSPAVQVFSVLICYKKMSKALKICGLLRFSFNGRKIDILKKADGYHLSGRHNTIPVLDGPILYRNFDPLSVICDLKDDTLDSSSIKGYQNSDYDRVLPRNKQLCSVFRGDHGFAALHYAIFPSAVQATLKVRYTEKGSKCVGIPVLGSFYAQYNDFNYSSEYEKKCYRIVIFKKIEKEDSVSVDVNGLIPLSRYSMVIPSNSSFRFDVHFIIGSREFSDQGNIKIGTSSMSIKSDECEVEIDLNWSEVK